ncbi:hypothetical protein P7C73_g129, partial [Tremellales sp. Uapishka_1]
MSTLSTQGSNLAARLQDNTAKGEKLSDALINWTGRTKTDADAQTDCKTAYNDSLSAYNVLGPYLMRDPQSERAALTKTKSFRDLVKDLSGWSTDHERGEEIEEIAKQFREVVGDIQQEAETALDLAKDPDTSDHADALEATTRARQLYTNAGAYYDHLNTLLNSNGVDV